MSGLPSEDDCLHELNQKLREHPDYEDKMEFRQLMENGSVSFYDPRIDDLLNGRREHDFTFAPFEAAIRAYAENHKRQR